MSIYKLSKRTAAEASTEVSEIANLTPQQFVALPIAQQASAIAIASRIASAIGGKVTSWLRAKIESLHEVPNPLPACGEVFHGAPAGKATLTQREFEVSYDGETKTPGAKAIAALSLRSLIDKAVKEYKEALPAEDVPENLATMASNAAKRYAADLYRDAWKRATDEQRTVWSGAFEAEAEDTIDNSGKDDSGKDDSGKDDSGKDANQPTGPDALKEFQENLKNAGERGGQDGKTPAVDAPGKNKEAKRHADTIRSMLDKAPRATSRPLAFASVVKSFDKDEPEPNKRVWLYALAEALNVKL